MTGVYTKEYFERLVQTEANMAIRLAPIVIDMLQPSSVIDWGCATGLYLQPFYNRGITTLGIDKSEIAIGMSLIPEQVMVADITKPLDEGRYDLAMCIEVAEHIESVDEAQLFDNLCLSADTILFSGATPEQTGGGHVNACPREHWLECFTERGFGLDTKKTDELVVRIQQGYCLHWLPKNAMILTRITESEDMAGGNAMQETWKQAQKHEEKWWDTCQNTYNEEEKQLRYAALMGLEVSPTWKTQYSFDLQNISVLDIGGGGASLLLKCRNVKGKVIDPLTFPDWVLERYKSADIEYEQIKAEDINEQGWDEVWIYNTLTHVENPKQVIEKAKIAGKCIRVFEWLDIPADNMHPHQLNAVDLDMWLEGKGTVTERENIAGKEYYGVFSGSSSRQDIPVHFILTSNELTYSYYLAIVSALKTQNTDRILLWAFEQPKGEYWPLLKDRIEFHIMDRPKIVALTDQSSLRYCTDVSNLVEWQILYDHGGICLDLDVFCVKDAIHYLAESDKDLILPHETEDWGPSYPLFNASIVMAKPKSILMKEVYDRAKKISEKLDLQRGEISAVIRDVGRENLDKIDTVKYGILGGGGTDHRVDRLAKEDAVLWPDAGILHLFANDSPFFADLSPEFIACSNILFARTVREILEEDEWRPFTETPLAIQRILDPTPDTIEIPSFAGIVKQKKRFHLLCLPHLVADDGDSLACAFTQKVRKMGKMMMSLGHTVYVYGVQGGDVECTEFVSVSTQDILQQTYGGYDMKKESYRHNLNDFAYRTFNDNTIPEIRKRMQPDDFLLIPFCPQGYRKILDALETKFVATTDRLYLVVEMGIGYRYASCRFRVYESSSQMHYDWGLQNQPNGNWYDVVIPNYFQPDDFHYSAKKGNYFVYLGRIIGRKGIREAIATVSAIGAKLVVAGQDGKENVNLNVPGVEYIGFVGVEERKNLLAGAKGLFLPTIYVEPFGGVVIEAAFSGTPVITSNWGAFPELVIHGQTGYRCNTLKDFVWAAKNIDKIRPIDCYKYAISNFSLDRVKWMYEKYFDMLLDVKQTKAGWDLLSPELTELDWLRRELRSA